MIAPYMVTIRYRPGLGPDWRAKFDDPLEGTTRLMDIRSIEPVGSPSASKLAKRRARRSFKPVPDASA